MSARLLKGAEAAAFTYAPLPIPDLDAVAALGDPVHPAFHHAAPEHLDLLDVDPRIEAHEEAAAIIDRARAEAMRLVADAKAQAAATEREARDRGLADARATVAEEVERVARPICDRLAETLDEVGGLHETVAARVERDVLKLALAIARKIVMRETTTDPDVALTLVRVALDRLRTRAVAYVHLHPEDCAYVGARAERLTSGGTIELVPDAAIHRGGCIVKTDMGEVDARIERQFAEIERGLIGA